MTYHGFMLWPVWTGLLSILSPLIPNFKTSFMAGLDVMNAAILTIPVNSPGVSLPFLYFRKELRNELS